MMNLTLLRVYVALLVLLTLTLVLAFVDLGILNTPVSLSIAVLKAGLVALFFMELRWKKGMIRIAAFAGLLWLGVLVALCLCDVLTRNQLLLPGHWPIR